MNYSLKHANPVDIIYWINEAIKRRASVVAILSDKESHDSDWKPRYLLNHVAAELIKLINEEDERYSLRFAIDVKSEISKAMKEGMAGIDFAAAKRAFPDLLIGLHRRKNLYEESDHLWTTLF